MESKKIDSGDWLTLWAAVALIAAGLFLVQVQAAVIEAPGGAHATLYQFTIQPDRGGAVTQPETGVKIERLTDVAKTTSTLSPNPKAWEGLPDSGLTNGYSRWPCVNNTEEYALAFLVTPGCYLIRLSDLKAMRMMSSPALGKIGDKHEINWSNRADEPYTIYYCGGTKIYKQNVLTGVETIAGDWGAAFVHTGDGGLSTDGRYKAVAISGNKLKVFDLIDNRLLPGWGSESTVGVDISPDGKWVRGNTTWRRVSAFQNATTVSVVWKGISGHGAFVAALDGHSIFCQQSNDDDAVVMFDPATGVKTKLQKLTDIGGGVYNTGVHVSRDPLGNARGWAMISGYGGSAPFTSNVWFLEMKENPRIIRLCDFQHKYLSTAKNAYFTEMWSSLAPDCKSALAGCNWHGTDNLELYRAEFPADVMAVVKNPLTTPAPTATPTPQPTATPTATPAAEFIPGGTTKPVTGPAQVTYLTPTPIPTATPAPAVQRIQAIASNYFYASKDTIGNTTRDGYILICQFDHAQPSSTRIDTGALLAFSIPVIPDGSKARLVVHHHPSTEGGILATGRESIPIRRILGNLFQAAYIAHPANPGESAYNGASWLYRSQTPDDKGIPWSNLPSTAPGAYAPRVGDLSTALEPITAATPRLSFSTVGTTSSVDITEYVRGTAGGTLQLAIDGPNAASPDIFATPGGTKTHCVNVAIYGCAADDPKVQPYVELWK